MKKDWTTRSVWMIIPSFFPAVGGAETQVRRLSKRMVENGQSVRVLTRQHGPALPDGLAAGDVVDGVPVKRLYSRGPGKVGSLLFMLGGLWYLFLHGRRAVYHAKDVGAAGWLAVVARYLLGGRCLIKMRTGCYGYEKRYGSRLARWQFATLLRLADHVQVVNSEVERMVCNLGVPRGRVIRLPNSVDTTVFRPATMEEKTEALRQFGVPNKKTIVLWVGRMAPIKGLDLLLHAWAMLSEGLRMGAFLVLVGDGRERDKLQKMTDQLGLRKSVHFAGAHKTVRDYYWAADLFVLPSRTEGLSGALIEAMACGLPAIASNVGGARDVISKDRNGMLFEQENSEQLAHQLSELLAMPEQRQEMGAMARKTVIEYANLDLIAGRMNNLYLQLLKHPN